MKILDVPPILNGPQEVANILNGPQVDAMGVPRMDERCLHCWVVANVGQRIALQKELFAWADRV